MNQLEYEKKLLVQKIDAQRKLVRHELRATRSSVGPVVKLTGIGKDAAQLVGPATRIYNTVAGTPERRKKFGVWALAALVVGLPAFFAVRGRR